MPLTTMAKVLVARQLCRPAIGRLVAAATGDRVLNRGATIDTGSPLVLPEVKASLYWGFYESAEIRFVQRYLPADLDVVELGASIGVVSAHIARRLAKGRRLLCVEPNPGLHGLVERNVGLNASGVALRMVHGAVAYGGSSVRFAVARKNIDSRIAVDGDGVHVPAVRLGALLQQEGLGDYALVSDIEGGEAALLAEDGGALARCRLVIAELHATEHGGRAVSVEDLVCSLVGLGFSIVDRHGPVVVARRAGEGTSP
jgi:FkbM family methyltransferase